MNGPPVVGSRRQPVDNPRRQYLATRELIIGSAIERRPNISSSCAERSFKQPQANVGCHAGRALALARTAQGEYPMSTDYFLSIIRFLLVGLVNTAVGLGLIYFCKWALGWGDVPSNMIGYACGLTVSFLLNRSWTFNHRGAVLPTIARFLVVFLVSYSLNLVTVLILIDHYAVNAYLAHAIAILPYTASFFIGSRHFAFAEQRTKTSP
jgi:putative flippase GtrA